MQPDRHDAALLLDMLEHARRALDRSPGDRFRVSGSELFLHLPNGVAGTRLTNQYFDRALGTACTIRNWRTVTALAAMTAQSA